LHGRRVRALAEVSASTLQLTPPHLPPASSSPSRLPLRRFHRLRLSPVDSNSTRLLLDAFAHARPSPLQETRPLAGRVWIGEDHKTRLLHLHMQGPPPPSFQSFFAGSRLLSRCRNAPPRGSRRMYRGSRRISSTSESVIGLEDKCTRQLW
jgi:hypothetical protein